MNQNEFSSLAESIIDYIDEITRNKKKTVNISHEAIEIISMLDKAIQKFGTYSYDDKGPYEVMNIDAIVKNLQGKPVKEIGKILSEVLDNT